MPHIRPRRRFAVLLPVLLATVVATSPTLAITFQASIALGTYGQTLGAADVLAVGSDGALHAVFTEAIGDATYVIHRRSADDGRTWSKAFRIGGMTTDQGSAHIDATGTAVDVVWVDATNQISYRRSSDGGRTWQLRKVLSTDQAHRLPKVERTTTGRVVVAYTGDDGLVVRTSSDAGVSFAAEKVLSSDFPAASITASGANVHVAWTWQNETGVRTSKDGGVTWGSAKFLSTTADGNPPAIAASGSTVVVAFGRQTATDQYVQSRRSTDNGTTWTSAVSVLDAALPQASNAVLTVSGSSWWAAVERCVTTACTSTQTYTMSSSTGNSWSGPSRISITADTFAWPIGLARTGRVHVLYQTQDVEGVLATRIRSGS